MPEIGIGRRSPIRNLHHRRRSPLAISGYRTKTNMLMETAAVPISETKLIPLDQAFQWVKSHLGAVDKATIGGQPGVQVEPIEHGIVVQTAEATGPTYKRKFTSAEQPGRKGRPPYAPKPLVPAVPDRHQLAAMLHDDAHFSAETSEAEKLICRTHRWFVDSLRSTRVRMWAEDRIAPLDGSPEVVTHPRRSLLFDLWKCADVDYRAAAAFPPGDDWETRADGLRVSGSRHLTRVTVDEDGLEGELQIGQIEAKLSYGGIEEAETWTISWNGTKIDIECAKAEARSRAMRALALLLLNPGRPISCPLLASLRRRKVGKESSSASDHETVRLRGLIDLISTRLMAGCITLEAADNEVQSRLSTQIKPTLLTRTDFDAKEYDVVYSALSSIRDYIRAIGGTAALEIANHLQESVRRRAGGFRYDQKGKRVSWSFSTAIPFITPASGTPSGVD